MPQQRKGEGVTPQQQAGVVQLGKMMAGGEEQSGHLDDFDQEVQQELEQHPKYEAEHKKMRAAMEGGDTDMGPGQFEQTQAQQTQALGQQNVVQGAQKAQQAQAGLTPVNEPIEAPGPTGESSPYAAQKGQGQDAG